MPSLKPQAMAYDATHAVTYLYATCSKDRYLLTVSQAMKLEVVRKVPSQNSDIFWVTNGVALWWKMETTAIVPLVADAKTKSLKGALEWRALASPTIGKYSVTEDQRVVVFDGAAWRDCDSSAPAGHIIYGDLFGAYQRTLRPGDWQTLVDQPASSVHTTLAISGDRSHWLIAASSGTYLCPVGTTKAKKTSAKWAWCAIGFGDRFFTSSNNTVWSFGLDGKQTDTGIGADDPPDHALFACGSRAFYLTGTNTIYRYENGDWTEHDIGKLGKAVGIG